MGGAFPNFVRSGPGKEEPRPIIWRLRLNRWGPKQEGALRITTQTPRCAFDRSGFGQPSLGRFPAAGKLTKTVSRERFNKINTFGKKAPEARNLTARIRGASQGHVFSHRRDSPFGPDQARGGEWLDGAMRHGKKACYGFIGGQGSFWCLAILLLSEAAGVLQFTHS